MRYMGGKSRTGKHLAKVINKHLLGYKNFYEPFVGGFNIVPHVRTSGRIECSDANAALISLYHAVKTGWPMPTTVSEDQYQEAKSLPDSDPLKAFVGLGCSFGGKWFGGYAKSSGRNYALNAHRSLTSKSGYMLNANFYRRPYGDVQPSDGAVVYCDPPYEGTTAYGAVGGFDHERFWSWCQSLAERCTVLVSEYSCPVDHDVVFIKDQLTTVSRGTGYKKATEKLFLVKPISKGGQVMNAFFHEGCLVVSPCNADQTRMLADFMANTTPDELKHKIVFNVASCLRPVEKSATPEAPKDVPDKDDVDQQPPERSKREELADLCREAGATEDQIKGKRATGLAKLLEELKTPRAEEKAAPEEEPEAEPETVYVSHKDLLAVIQAYVGPKESTGWAERRQKVKGMFPEGKANLSKFEPEDRQALFDQVSKLEPEAEEWE